MNFLTHKKDVFFVSAVDRFQAEFDLTHPKSASQEAEIRKYQRIYQLRDGAVDSTGLESRDKEQ